MKILVVGGLCLDHYSGAEGAPLLFPGGKGGNQAVAAKRLGATVTLAAKIGADQKGASLLEELKAEKIKTELVSKTKLPTGHCHISLNKGNYRIKGYPGANLAWNRKELAKLEPHLASCDCLLTQFEIPSSFSLELVKMAQNMGKLVILNPAPPRKALFPPLAPTTYLVCNREEARFYTGLPVEDLAQAKRAAEKLKQLGGTPIITLEQAGALIEGELVPAPKANALDPTGAGDRFCASLAVALLQGKSPREAVHFANGEGALATTALGAQS